MLEFKLNMYFQEYKDTVVIPNSNFRDNFKNKHGNFTLLSELIHMIEKYQFKRYGRLLENGSYTIKREKRNTYNDREKARNYYRYGNKKERQERKRFYNE